VPRSRRTWTGYSVFAMWMSDVHSVGGYTFAASLFLLGISGWQVLLALALGILVVYVLMNWVGKSGTSASETTRRPCKKLELNFVRTLGWSAQFCVTDVAACARSLRHR